MSVVSRRHPVRLVAGAAILAAAFALSACSGSPTPAATSGAAAEPTYVTEGKFTVATGEPAYEPWVLDNKPESGKGFESAVAYAVADELGFAKDDVVWVRDTFEQAIAPGAKDFDVNLQQFSITDDRKKAVDFSSPYYETGQAVVTLKGSKAASAASIADLKGLLIGAATGTTSFAAIETVIAPSQGAQAFNNNDDAKAALQNGQVDAIVLDVPTASYFVEDGVILGKLPAAEGTSDELGLVLAKDSSLTASVTAAVDTLRENGTLDDLANTWLTDYTGIKELQ